MDKLLNQLNEVHQEYFHQLTIELIQSGQSDQEIKAVLSDFLPLLIEVQNQENNAFDELGQPEEYQSILSTVANQVQTNKAISKPEEASEQIIEEDGQEPDNEATENSIKSQETKENIDKHKLEIDEQSENRLNNQAKSNLESKQEQIPLEDTVSATESPTITSLESSVNANESSTINSSEDSVNASQTSTINSSNEGISATEVSTSNSHRASVNTSESSTINSFEQSDETNEDSTKVSDSDKLKKQNTKNEELPSEDSKSETNHTIEDKYSNFSETKQTSEAEIDEAESSVAEQTSENHHYTMEEIKKRYASTSDFYPSTDDDSILIATTKEKAKLNKKKRPQEEKNNSPLLIWIDYSLFVLACISILTSIMRFISPLAPNFRLTTLLIMSFYGAAVIYASYIIWDSSKRRKKGKNSKLTDASKILGIFILYIIWVLVVHYVNLLPYTFNASLSPRVTLSIGVVSAIIKVILKNRYKTDTLF